MPSWLQTFADINPFTITVDAMRALFVGAEAGNAVWGTLAYCVVLLVVFVPLSVARYRRAVTR
jgi:ABC-type polysaccharide/polyol phosphate export permease